MASCPVGYYTQTIADHKKCVQTCTGGLFGDNVTKSCVSSCPAPSFADPVNSVCVKECPDDYYAQIAIADGNRACVNPSC